MECPVNENLAKRTGCILTYGGSTLDIAINYLTFLCLLIPCIIRCKQHTIEWQRYSLFSLLSVIAFQIGLCWILGCAGISIVWCAMVGWMAQQRESRNYALNLYEKWSIGLALQVVVYYGFTSPPITTVAHFCALLLGYTLSSSSPLFLEHRHTDYDEVVNGSP